MLRTTSVFFLISLGLMSACTRINKDHSLKIFRFRLSEDVKTLDPAQMSDTISATVLPNIYESLYQYSYLKRPFQLEPLLAADRPKFSADRLTLRIPIRRGVHFANDPCFPDNKGREMTAHDFVTAVKRHALPGIVSQGLWAIEGKIAGFDAFKTKLEAAKKEDRAAVFKDESISGFKATEDFALEIKLLRPYPQLLHALAMPFFSPVPQEAIAKYADETGSINEHPVGTGPYTLTSWRRSNHLILDRNPQFHSDFYPTEADEALKQKGYLKDAGKPLPLTDRIDFEVVKEEQPAWLRFLTGEFDAYMMNKDSLEQGLDKSGALKTELVQQGFKLETEASGRFFYLEFNLKDPILGGNKLLRQAISSSLDREKFIKTMYSGRGVKQQTIVPLDIDGYDAKQQLKYDFAPLKAKELLAKAGFPGGKGLPILSLDMRSADTLSRQQGDFVHQALSDIGIQVDINLNTFPSFLEKLKKGNFQMSFGGWQIDYPDPESALQVLYGPNKAPGPNYTYFNHPEYNRLFERMARLESSSERNALIAKMESIVQEEVPWAMLFHTRFFGVSPKTTRNFLPSEMVLNRMKYFGLDR